MQWHRITVDQFKLSVTASNLAICFVHFSSFIMLNFCIYLFLPIDLLFVSELFLIDVVFVFD